MEFVNAAGKTLWNQQAASRAASIEIHVQRRFGREHTLYFSMGHLASGYASMGSVSGLDSLTQFCTSASSRLCLRGLSTRELVLTGLLHARFLSRHAMLLAGSHTIHRVGECFPVPRYSFCTSGGAIFFAPLLIPHSRLRNSRRAVGH